MSATAKFCKDCKHFRPFTFPSGLDAGAQAFSLSRCALAARSEVNLITGESEEKGGFCENERATGSCGPEGKLFEAAAP